MKLGVRDEGVWGYGRGLGSYRVMIRVDGLIVRGEG